LCYQSEHHGVLRILFMMHHPSTLDGLSAAVLRNHEPCIVQIWWYGLALVSYPANCITLFNWPKWTKSTYKNVYCQYIFS